MAAQVVVSVVDGHFLPCQRRRACELCPGSGFAYFRVFSRLRRKLSEGKLFCANFLNDASKAFLEREAPAMVDADAPFYTCAIRRRNKVKTFV